MLECGPLSQSNFFSFNRADLQDWIASRFPNGNAESRARAVFTWVYRRGRKLADIEDVSREVVTALHEELVWEVPHPVTNQRAKDGTRKALWRLQDGQTVESVLLPHYRKWGGKIHTPFTRMSVCVSSQVGCAMACAFCVTGKQGFTRNLAAHEIVTQVTELAREAQVRNVVFMGMGEPLHNDVAVAKAVEIFRDPFGLGLSRKNITVSTSGLLPKVIPFVEKTGVRMAFSLNAPRDSVRDELMPVNRAYPVEELLRVAREASRASGLTIILEYILMGGLTDGAEDAAELAARISEHFPYGRALLNLIPFNPSPGIAFERPTPERVKWFQNEMIQRNIPTTVRYSGGQEVAAACGQLKSAASEVKSAASA